MEFLSFYVSLDVCAAIQKKCNFKKESLVFVCKQLDWVETVGVVEMCVSLQYGYKTTRETLKLGNDLSFYF